MLPSVENPYLGSMEYQIDPDIRQASTLPGHFYSDPQAFAQLRETAFARSWQWVGVQESVPEPGSAYPFTLLPGLIDEPLVLTRDQSGLLHCLSNVCTHRGSLLVHKAGACARLRCRYHGRRFGLDGRLEQMPGFEGALDFPSARDHLPRLPWSALGRFIFTSLQPALPFETWLGGLQERVGAAYPWDQLRLDASRTKAYTFDANWALYLDNYLEGFHIPFVHKSLNATLAKGEYETVLLPHGNVQVGVAAPGQPILDLPPTSPDFGRNIAAYYFWFFPNFMLNVYPWGVSVNIVRPLSIGQTQVTFLTYILQPQLLDKGAGSDLHRVEMEDEEVVLDVQRGVRARLYDRGRYSPRMEQGVHQFHQMLVACLG
jgi:choline monooxygenase